MNSSLLLRYTSLNKWVIQDQYQDIYMSITSREKAEFILLALHRAKGGTWGSVEEVKKEFDMAYSCVNNTDKWLKIQRSW